LDARTLNAYLPIARAIGGKLAIVDYAPTPEYLARYADTIATEIARWLGITWVEATATTPGHWAPLRAGEPPVLPRYVPPPPTIICPRGATATATGCVFPPGTIATFSKRRGKWRIAVPAAALKTTALQPGAARRTFGAAGTHVVVAEVDTPPPGVQQVEESQFEEATGEAPTEGAPPTMVMYVCPDGTRVTDPSTCPSPPPPKAEVPPRAAPPPAPEALPPPSELVPPAPPAEEAPPTEGRYKGCIARYNITRKVYSIYCPVGSPAAKPGLGIVDDEYFRCLFGNCHGLGESEVTPPPPEGYVKTAEVTTLPRAGETVAGKERDKFFRLKNPYMWLTFAGVAAVGSGSYYFIRRRRRGSV
jgi:hypothetical protein